MLFRGHFMKQAKTLDERELKVVLGICATRRYAARDRAIVLFSFCAGLRAKELAALRIGNVVGEAGKVREECVLTPSQTKGSKARRIFINSRLQRELSVYIKDLGDVRSSQPLFSTQKRTAFSANSMCHLFIDIYAEAGIVGASSHSGRRSLLTSLASKGVGVRVLQEIAGHSSIAVTQRYIDVNDQQMRAAVEMM